MPTYDGQFTSSTQLTELNNVVISPTHVASLFFLKLALFILLNNRLAHADFIREEVKESSHFPFGFVVASLISP